MVKSSKTKTAPRRRPNKTVYDSWEDVYCRHKPEELPWYSPFVHPVLQTVLEHIPQRNGKAIDIGCGFGQVARFLAGLGWTVTAIDISESAIRKARELTPPGASILYRTQNSLELAKSLEFDLVVDYLHLHDIQPQDTARYLSLLAGLSSRWIVLGYLCSKEEPLRRPSLYFDGIVTQHSHRQLSDALAPYGFQKVARKSFTLSGTPVQYECEVLTFSSRPTGGATRKGGRNG